MRSSREKKTRITSALFPKLSESGIESTLNQAASVAKWITEGCKPEKIVVGIAAYGRSFELENHNRADSGAPTIGAGLPGTITNEPGILSYFEICDKSLNSNSTKGWDKENLAPYLVYDKNYWVTYEDPESISEKMIFIKANNLGGAFLWSIDLDDFLGEQCKQGPYPLMAAIKNELTNKIKPEAKKNLIRLLLKSNAKTLISSGSFTIVLFLLYIIK